MGSLLPSMIPCPWAETGHARKNPVKDLDGHALMGPYTRFKWGCLCPDRPLHARGAPYQSRMGFDHECYSVLVTQSELSEFGYWDIQ